jgi:Na+-driven multidrug efflux pump
VGRGNHLQASRSAFKSLIIGMSVGTALAFSFYGLLGNHLFKLLDYNQIGTEMTNLIPLSCLCSIVMTNGMLGWALLGAQGRVRLATFVTIITSWIVTIPIAAIFVFMRVYDLQGLVSAVTMGYSVSSTIIMYLLIRTNWKKRSEKVKRVTSIVSDDDSTSSSYPHEYSDNEIRELAPFESTPPIKAVDTPLQMKPIVESDSLEMVR